MYPEILFYPTQYEIKKYIEMGKQYREELLKELEQEKMRKNKR